MFQRPDEAEPVQQRRRYRDGCFGQEPVDGVDVADNLAQQRVRSVRLPGRHRLFGEAQGRAKRTQPTVSTIVQAPSIRRRSWAISATTASRDSRIWRAALFADPR